MRFPSIDLHDRPDDSDKERADKRREFRYSREESFGHLIRIVSRAFMRSLQLRLERHDVTLGQWAFLRILWERDGELTQRELAEIVGLSEPSAKFSLNSLENKGLVTRVQNPGDLRKHNMWLTREGRALKKKLLPFAKEVSDIALNGMDPGEVAAMTEGIHRVIASLQRDIESQGKLASTDKAASRLPGRRPRKGK